MDDDRRQKVNRLKGQVQDAWNSPRVQRRVDDAQAFLRENVPVVGGAHALAKLLQWPCDGVLLDRNLPDLDAQEVAEQIACAAEVKVLV